MHADQCKPMIVNAQLSNPIPGMFAVNLKAFKKRREDTPEFDFPARNGHFEAWGTWLQPSFESQSCNVTCNSRHQPRLIARSIKEIKIVGQNKRSSR